MVRWERDVMLSGLTRYGIGGPATRLARPGTRDELRKALLDVQGSTYRVLGGGANVLVSDEGVHEAVLVLGGSFDYVTESEETLEAGAAARLPALVGAARRHAREGWSFLEAVPGTVGGGLRMNAGSRDVWLWHRARWAEAMLPDGEVVRIEPGDADPSYRRIGIPDSWVFLCALFYAPPGDAQAIDEEHVAFRSRKVASQVYDLPSVGSTWKNPGPPIGSAWAVVDRVGMRGARRGDAQISEHHANFIVNHGSARAEDVLELMVETRRRAHEQLGVSLEPEICMWGFDSEQMRLVGSTA
jgi:UDP-N-acetylmuramate dehydrogenase